MKRVKPRIRVYPGESFTLPVLSLPEDYTPARPSLQGSNVHVLPGYGPRDPYAVMEAARDTPDVSEVTVIFRDIHGRISFESSHERLSETLWDVRHAQEYYL